MRRLPLVNLIFFGLLLFATTIVDSGGVVLFLRYECLGVVLVVFPLVEYQDTNATAAAHYPLVEYAKNVKCEKSTRLSRSRFSNVADLH